MSLNTLGVTYYLANQLSDQIKIIATNRSWKIYYLSIELYELSSQEAVFIKTFDELYRLNLELSNHENYEKVTNEIYLANKFQISLLINSSGEPKFSEVYQLANSLYLQLEKLATEFTIELYQWKDIDSIFDRKIKNAFYSVRNFRDYMYF